MHLKMPITLFFKGILSSWLITHFIMHSLLQFMLLANKDLSGQEFAAFYTAAYYAWDRSHNRRYFLTSICFRKQLLRYFCGLNLCKWGNSLSHQTQKQTLPSQRLLLSGSRERQSIVCCEQWTSNISWWWLSSVRMSLIFLQRSSRITDLSNNKSSFPEKKCKNVQHISKKISKLNGKGKIWIMILARNYFLIIFYATGRNENLKQFCKTRPNFGKHFLKKSAMHIFQMIMQLNIKYV